MDFHAAMETFAEAWVAANVHTAVNTEAGQVHKQIMEDSLSLVSKDQSKIKTPHHVNHQAKSQPTSPTTGAKSLPIHCVVEQTGGPVTFEDDGSSHFTVELDSYAILPCTTLFSELVRAALVKLGYNSTESMNAKGAIQIKNWRPLSFETISNNANSTIEDILGELTQVAKLRIRLCSKAKLSSADEVKGRLLQLLLNQSQGLLINSGCPIEKTLLTSFAKGDAYANLSPELRRAFDKWYAEQIRSIKPEEVRNIHETSPEKQTEATHQNESTSVSSSISSAMASSPLYHCKTRMRTSFDPEHEIPRLQKWFQDNQHPTREQMIHYLDELNSLDARKGRRPLDLTNIIYWFKNARAAHRRASRQYDGDGSFDMEDGQREGSPNGDSSLPFLPNKNAVYMLPYPIHGHYPTQEESRSYADSVRGQHISNEDSREPFDLSQSRNSNSSQNKSPSEIKTETSSPSKDEDSIQLKQEADDSENNNKSSSAVNGGKSVESNSADKNGHRSNRRSVSDSEGDDSDFDDDQSNVGSESSHEAANLSIKNNIENQGFLSNGLAHLHKSSTGLHQPLHIPHFPHPLAMHYFPMNTHFMAQQAARYNQQQQTSPMSRSNSSSNTHRKRRTRVFIDPMSEIPILEKWFAEDTHPSSYMIDKFCEELNRSEYRQKFPKLEPKNIQLWFKNHRAKVKRMRLSQDYDQAGLDSDDQSDIIKREIH